MANQTSNLIVRLRDEVSGPTSRASRSLKNLKSDARGTAQIGSAVANATRGIVPAAGGALGVAGIAVGLRTAYLEAAKFDRRMTRIGITADATADATRAATKQVQGIAREVAVPINDVTSGLETLVSQGRSLSDSLSFLPSVARTAQASGAAVDDIASTANAVGRNFDIAGQDMQRAFDIMVQGGKAGQFELRDMARYLPSLAPSAASVGLKGAQGLEQMVAMLQVVRQNTGTTEEAAASMANIFQKMESEETAKKFGKFGINLRKEMATARKQGRNLLEVFEELSAKALKGDLSKLPQLFSDMELARGMRALLMYRGEWQQLQAEIHKTAPGSVMRDLGRVTGDAQASVDNLSNSWDRFTNSLGRGLDAIGVSSGLNSISSSLERFVDQNEKANDLRRIAREEMEKEGQNRKTFDPFGWLPKTKDVPQSEKDQKILEGLSGGKHIRDNIGIGRGSYRLKNTTLNLNDLVGSENEEIRKAGAQRYLEQQRSRAAAYHDADRTSALRRAGELNELAARQKEGGHFGLRDTERKLFMVNHDLEVMRRTAQGRMTRSQSTLPWAGDDSEARGGGMPSTAPLPPRRPDLDIVKGKAADAGGAIQALAEPVSLNVDDSKLDATLAKARAVNAELERIAGNASRASAAVQSSTSGSFGQRFQSRRDGSFADWE
ncbi:phage tail tape measure protein [Microvirga mediterraneensis]|uniref:Phage tail tape measure protein n=1 Tax=Microvirga mediterraneensis TaxID=2754695 RepID=A0A838BU51_9HYPH|nr:phage tail tape measure protein [Microvirga mediterraneensis]MBA1157966.1 phage tail tape measure protein [Microvirga mediterraneensis]